MTASDPLAHRPAPLAHDLLGSAAAGAPVAFLMHGILGSRRNWGTFARRLSEAFPRWRLVNLDLRNHGDTEGALPPHTVAACAADLAALAAKVGQPRLVIGHSFGGKVALAFARDHGGPALHHVWALDSALDTEAVGQANEVAAVVARARALPLPAESREAVVAHFTEAGFSLTLARWMTTNVRRVAAPGAGSGGSGLAGGFEWRFDLDAIEAMLHDYWREDLWPWLEALPAGVQVNVLRAGRSDRWTAEVVARLAALAPQVRSPELAEAGHWVHVDDPDGLFALLAESFALD